MAGRVCYAPATSPLGAFLLYCTPRYHGGLECAIPILRLDNTVDTRGCKSAHEATVFLLDYYAGRTKATVGRARGGVYLCEVGFERRAWLGPYVSSPGPLARAATLLLCKSSVSGWRGGYLPYGGLGRRLCFPGFGVRPRFYKMRYKMVDIVDSISSVQSRSETVPAGRQSE